MFSMNEAAELAKIAVEFVAVGNPEPVADTTVLFKNADGTFSVTDNARRSGLQDRRRSYPNHH